MPKVIIKLNRHDREPGGDHAYGPKIDAELDTLAGRPLDRTGNEAPLTLPGRGKIELHEDGPLIQAALEKLPEILNAVAALLTAWCAWKARPQGQPTAKPSDLGRNVEISVGDHRYVGKPSPKEAARIARFLASL